MLLRRFYFLISTLLLWNLSFSKLNPFSYRKLSPYNRLATTPLFYVCNSGGNPYLQDDVQTNSPDQRIIVYFMSSNDAMGYLNEMSQGNPSSVNEFRIMATSMERIMNKLQSKKQSRKIGRYPINTMIRIQPSLEQCNHAEWIAGKGNKRDGVLATQGLSIPMFTSKDILVKRKNGELVTPYYFNLEDLHRDIIRSVQPQPPPQSPLSLSLPHSLSLLSLSTSTSSSYGVSQKHTSNAGASNWFNKLNPFAKSDSNGSVADHSPVVSAMKARIQVCDFTHVMSLPVVQDLFEHTPQSRRVSPPSSNDSAANLRPFSSKFSSLPIHPPVTASNGWFAINTLTSTLAQRHLRGVLSCLLDDLDKLYVKCCAIANPHEIPKEDVSGIPSTTVLGGIVPPRDEIDWVRKHYRNDNTGQSWRRGEYQRSRLHKPLR